MIFRDKPDGHPDQVPNILILQDMIENPPPWLKLFLPPKARPPKILALWKAEKETDSKTKEALYLVLQDSSLKDLILPPPYQAPPHPPSPSEEPGAAEGAPPLPDEGISVCGPAAGTRRGTHRGASPPNAGLADSTTLPSAPWDSPDETGGQLMLYWLFSTSDLYN